MQKNQLRRQIFDVVFPILLSDWSRAFLMNANALVSSGAIQYLALMHFLKTEIFSLDFLKGLFYGNSGLPEDSMTES